ncbi:MAG: UvrD-helicase domain-containing protein [Solirubrobacteraceae bacterium]|nr:UvrD-helicase domain-containing protein [Solirubrobacteraceae bacterium]
MFADLFTPQGESPAGAEGSEVAPKPVRPRRSLAEEAARIREERAAAEVEADYADEHDDAIEAPASYDESLSLELFEDDDAEDLEAQRVQASLDVLLEGMNENQRKAVLHDLGPVLVIAGAGSGKTRVLTHRIAYLVRAGRARHDEILAITFTNKAAQEMRDRVEGMLGARIKGMWVTTFHSACVRILRSEADKLGYTKAFTIYDQSDARRMVKRCLDELGVDPKRFTPASVLNQISDAKNKLRDSEDQARLVGSYFERTVSDVYRLYESELIKANAMDFDDLLVRTVNLLELFPEVRKRYQQAFRYILVDEYQDTNHAQYRLLRLLAGEHHNLMVVGDDAQSLDGFRGADIRNILDFEEDEPDATVITLDQNYRSTQTILSAANAVIAGNREQKQKNLWSENGQGDPINVRETEDEHAEARFVVGEIERLVDEEDVGRSDVACFYRTNAQARVLEDMLIRRDIDYQVIGGTRFYERAEIKDALAYLTLVVNPRDLVAFQRVINTPKRGLGATSVGRVLQYADAIGENPLKMAAEADKVPNLGASAVKNMKAFASTIRDLRRTNDDGAPVSKLLEQALEKSGYIEYLENERSVEAEGRIENLRELVNVAAEFDVNDQTTAGVDGFLQELSLVADTDSRTDDGGIVTLMSLHNAKGLEYPVVFILGWEDGVFPHSRSFDEGTVEEERRLAYVGITRAKERLYLSWAQRRQTFGQTNYAIKSRFLAEIPGELIAGGAVDERPAFGGGAGGYRARGPRGATTAPPAGGGDPKTSDGTALHIGDDVEHRQFGVGTIVGAQAGGVVIVRFADDGVERKLMAEYAPLSKR